MKKLSLAVMATALLLCVQPGEVSAQDAAAGGVSVGNRQGFSISPIVGGISFNDDLDVESAPVFGLRVGYNFNKYLGVEGLFDYARTQFQTTGNSADYYRYGADLLLHMWPDNKFVPYLAAGYAGMDLTADKTEGAANAGVGFKYFVTEDMAWRGDVRGISYDSEYAIEYTTGVYIPFGGAAEPVKLADPPVPPPPAIRLEQPIPVAKPSAPAAPVAPPEVSLAAAPGTVLKGEKSTLSWKSQNADNCELRPGIGAVKTSGTLPVTPQEDTLYTLNCTGKGGSASSTAIVMVTVPAVGAVEPSAPQKIYCNKPARIMINFDTDKYNVKPQYHGELKKVGDFLTQYPEAYGEISGHTDSTHTDAYNQKLSERRAQSVKDHIIKRSGIDPKRLTSKGYGEKKPIATNKTAAGRAKNRRIETNLICPDLVGQPAPATPTPPAAAPPKKGSLPPGPSAAAPAAQGGAANGKAPSAKSVPPAKRKTEPQASSGLGAIYAEQGRAAEKPPFVPSALRTQQTAAAPPSEFAAGQQPAAPDPAPVPPAQRKQQPASASLTTPSLSTPAPMPSPAAAAPVAVALLPDPPPVDPALRKQEPEPPPADEEPFRLEATGAAPQGKLALTAITIDRDGMSLFATGKVNDFRMITNVEPFSLVIDLPGAGNGMGVVKAPVEKFDLLDVQFKEFPDRLQITLTAGREEIIPYRTIKIENGLRINIKPRSSHHIGP